MNDMTAKACMNDGQAISADTERALVRETLAGDQLAARGLVDAHRDRLHAFIGRMVRNHHEAEDLCQETFLRAFGSLERFNGTNRFSTWLFTIGYRLTLNRLRRKDNGNVAFDMNEMAAPRNDVPEALANSEEVRRLKATIWREVDGLSEPQRAAVVLFYQQNMSCQEIGQVLDTPPSTVKSHLHRAREKLRSRLEESVSQDWSALKFFGEAG